MELLTLAMHEEDMRTGDDEVALLPKPEISVKFEYAARE